MGKFKELDIDRRENKEKRMRELMSNYPSIASFIEEAFNANEEEKVYKLILAFKEEKRSCVN